MNKKDTMLDKFKTMNREELSQYRSAAKAASRMIDLIGIGIILCIMWFTSPLTVIPGALALYIFANIGVNLKDAITFIEERIMRLPKNSKNESDT